MNMQNQKQNKGEQIRNIYRKGDAFGISPKLFIDQDTQYKTAFGTTLSIMLFVIVLVACWIYGKDIYYKENPNSIMTEESTTHPEKWVVNKSTMNFCFSLTDVNWQHFSDPSIYRLDLVEKKMVLKKDENGNEYPDFIFKDLKPRKCKKSDFQIAEEYFHNLVWLETLYCMDHEESEIEGDFGAEIFTMIQGHLFPCTNSTDSDVVCQPQEVIDEKLKETYWTFTTTDTVIDPKNYENPFKPVGREIYGLSSNKMFKLIDLNYRNVYINDNTGIIFDSWSNKRGLQFSNTDKLVKNEPLESGQFFQFNIRFEKVKQTRIYRTYLNLAAVIANVGGVLKVFMLSFLIISGFVSSQYYNINVVNSLFSFEYKKRLSKKKKTKELKKQTTVIQNDNQKSGEKVSSDDLEQQQQNGSSGNIRNNKRRKTEKYTNQHNHKLFFENFFHSVTTLFSKKEEKIQKEMLDFSVKKLSYHLDIKRILQKMIEIDRLKALLLNEEQANLFEYLPKPVINEQMVGEGALQKQDSEALSPTKKRKRNINLLFEDVRTDSEKEKDAFSAYRSIITSNNRGHIDKRILKIMDIDLRKNFEDQLKNSNNNIDVSEINHMMEQTKGSQANPKESNFKFQNYDNSMLDNTNNQTKAVLNKEQFKEQDFDSISEEFRDFTVDIDDTALGSNCSRYQKSNNNMNGSIATPVTEKQRALSFQQSLQVGGGIRQPAGSVKLPPNHNISVLQQHNTSINSPNLDIPHSGILSNTSTARLKSVNNITKFDKDQYHNTGMGGSSNSSEGEQKQQKKTE